MTTARIHVSQVKPGDVRVFGTGVKLTVTKVNIAGGVAQVVYGSGLTLHNLSDSTGIEIELPDTHPIAVLERMRDRVEEQRAMNHQELLEAIRTGDEGRKIRRDADAKLLQGKLWGLGYAIMELRAGIEYYPGKDA